MRREPDRTVVQCNYAVPTNVAVRNARAYLVTPNPGWGNDRIFVLVKSRGGRWVSKWESIIRLINFRVKTIPPEDPLYTREIFWDINPEETAVQMNESRARLFAGKIL